MFGKKKNIEQINAMAIGADIISINNSYGHYEINGKVGITKEIELEKYILVYMGGILVDVKEK